MFGIGTAPVVLSMSIPPLNDEIFIAGTSQTQMVLRPSLLISFQSGNATRDPDIILLSFLCHCKQLLHFFFVELFANSGVVAFDRT